jgi:hypothetical protein
MSAFVRTIGIDHSGAETPTASLRGLRVYLPEGDASPAEVPSPPSPRKYWTRRGIAQWRRDPHRAWRRQCSWQSRLDVPTRTYA